MRTKLEEVAFPRSYSELETEHVGRMSSRHSFPLYRVTISACTDRAVLQEQKVQIYQW